MNDLILPEDSMLYRYTCCNNDCPCSGRMSEQVCLAHSSTTYQYGLIPVWSRSHQKPRDSTVTISLCLTKTSLHPANSDSFALNLSWGFIEYTFFACECWQQPYMTVPSPTVKIQTSNGPSLADSSDRSNLSSWELLNYSQQRYPFWK